MDGHLSSSKLAYRMVLTLFQFTTIPILRQITSSTKNNINKYVNILNNTIIMSSVLFIIKPYYAEMKVTKYVTCFQKIDSKIFDFSIG